MLKLQLVKRFIKKSWKQKSLFFFFFSSYSFLLLLLFSFSSQIDNLSTIFYYRSFEEGVRSLSFISRFLPQLFLHNILLIFFPFSTKLFLPFFSIKFSTFLISVFISSLHRFSIIQFIFQKGNFYFSVWKSTDFLFI